MDIIRLLLTICWVQLFIGFVVLRMDVFIASPNHFDIAFESVNELLALGDPIEAIFKVCLAAYQRQILINILFGEATFIEEEISDQFHDVLLLIIEIDIVDDCGHLFLP